MIEFIDSKQTKCIISFKYTGCISFDWEPNELPEYIRVIGTDRVIRNGKIIWSKLDCEKYDEFLPEDLCIFCDKLMELKSFF